MARLVFMAPFGTAGRSAHAKQPSPPPRCFRVICYLRLCKPATRALLPNASRSWRGLPSEGLHSCARHQKRRPPLRPVHCSNGAADLEAPLSNRGGRRHSAPSAHGKCPPAAWMQCRAALTAICAPPRRAAGPGPLPPPLPLPPLPPRGRLPGAPSALATPATR